MWSKKYWRVHTKLTVRKFKKNPHHLMGLIAVIAFSFAALKYTQFNQNKYEYSTFTEWKIYQENNDLENRSPASFDRQLICDENNISVSQIRSEIKALEKKYETGTYLQGDLYGLNIGKLSSIAAQLIAANKDLIGDSRKQYNFKECSDVPCVLNNIYQDSTELSGHYIYYWYLKTGSMISLNNLIPEQKSTYPGVYDEKVHEYQEYLFTQNELKKFYFLAKSLPEKLTFIPNLKSIHRIPDGSIIETAQGNCSQSLPNGQILLTKACLENGSQSFNINVTREIAKFVDRQEGLKINESSLSSSQKWLKQSLWFQESYFNQVTNEYQFKWKTDLQPENFIDRKSQNSPLEQISSLIAYYRFDPEKFKDRTPQDIAKWIESEIFHNKSFSPSGLYTQYINEAINSWSTQEVKIWKKCIDAHVQPGKIEQTQRDIASSLDHPLYQCVEKQIPGFVNYVKKEIQDNNFEGCQFFNDETKFGHVATQFDENINRYLLESVLQRKIEIRKHGEEVLIGQKIKDEFIQKVDPNLIYITCYAKNNPESCYHEKMNTHISELMSSNQKVSSYYTEVIKEDILSLFPFDNVKNNTNEMAKMFLAPYSARLMQAANKMWDNCKLEGADQSAELALPMTFSGGKHYVNAKLINCVNGSLKSELFKIAELKAFHKVGNDYVDFKLNSDEQKFALSFLQGKLLQTLNSILDKEFFAEKIRLDQFFKVKKIDTLANFSESKEFFTNVFSFEQVENMCFEKISAYYPDNYFYHSKPDMDKKYGREICSTFVRLGDVKKRLTKQVERQWQINKDVAKNFLKTSFSGFVSDCNSDYPIDKNSRSYVKDMRLRKICIEESYNQAISDSIAKWRKHKNYDYFANKEDELVRDFYGLRSELVSSAQ